jgi:hypothetical protein
MHNSPSDCWVSFNGIVLDLTALLKVQLLTEARFCRDSLNTYLLNFQANEGPLIQPLLRVAGTDISHWYEWHAVCRISFRAAYTIHAEPRQVRRGR